jgi:hypothetical protein
MNLVWARRIHLPIAMVLWSDPICRQLSDDRDSGGLSDGGAVGMSNHRIAAT